MKNEKKNTNEQSKVFISVYCDRELQKKMKMKTSTKNIKDQPVVIYYQHVSTSKWNNIHAVVEHAQEFVCSVYVRIEYESMAKIAYATKWNVE